MTIREAKNIFATGKLEKTYNWGALIRITHRHFRSIEWDMDQLVEFRRLDGRLYNSNFGWVED